MAKVQDEDTFGIDSIPVMRKISIKYCAISISVAILSFLARVFLNSEGIYTSILALQDTWYNQAILYFYQTITALSLALGIFATACAVVLLFGFFYLKTATSQDYIDQYEQGE